MERPDYVARYTKSLEALLEIASKVTFAPQHELLCRLIRYANLFLLQKDAINIASDDEKNLIQAIKKTRM